MQLSATTSGINDVKEVVKVAKNEQMMFKRKTILFVDEIHRFNKTQQVRWIIQLWYSFHWGLHCESNIIRKLVKVIFAVMK